MKSSTYEAPMESEEDQLVLVIVAADVELLGIVDRVHQNMEHRFCVCVEVADSQIEPFL